jgi:hypothetical protein
MNKICKYCGNRNNLFIVNLNNKQIIHNICIICRKNKISNTLKNHNVSEKTKRKIGNANRGKKYPNQCGNNNVSKRIEVRQKISKKLKGRCLSEQWKNKISESNKGNKHSIETIEKRRKSLLLISDKISNSLKGHIPWNKGKTNIYTKEIRDKISNTLKGQTPWNKGKKVKPHTNFTKQKMRKSAIKRIEQIKLNGLPLTPCIGKNETKILNDIENNKSIKLIRQYKVLGYFVDGYDILNNVVYEVDEQYHIKQLEKDKIRQEEIINELKCKFIRIKEYGNDIELLEDIKQNI